MLSKIFKLFQPKQVDTRVLPEFKYHPTAYTDGAFKNH
jgi:hypothetical protein